MKHVLLATAVSVCTVTYTHAQLNTQFIGQEKAGGFDYNWQQFSPEQIGDRKFNFNYNGVRAIKHAPPVGVHPRIYFNPEELPAIKNRLTTSTIGKEVLRKLYAYNTLLHNGAANYDRNAAYAKASTNQPFIPNVGTYDLHNNYYTFAKGDTTGYMAFTKRTNRFGSAIAMEALECLLRKDEKDATTGLTYANRASMLANVMTTVAQAAMANGLDWKKYDMVGGMGFAIAYDLNYWAMTDVQRATIRKAISAMVPDKPRYGSDNAPYATAGNWTTLNCFEIICNIAIEGEEGYKPQLTQLWMTSMIKFLNYGWYESGCPWEGLGKNYLMAGQQIAFAKRGFSLLGHPFMRAFANNYLPNIIQPQGFAFYGEDTWGGTGPDEVVGKYRFHAIDAVGFKYAYPNDKAVDFVWRNYVNTNNNGIEQINLAENFTPGTHNYFEVMTVLALFATDYTSGNWEVQNKTALNNKLDFFEHERGLAIMRSDFSQQALATAFYVRQNFGGHTYADRNDFSLQALGRIWVPKRYGAEGVYNTSDAQSIVLVDDKAMKINKKEGSKNRVPAKLVATQSNKNIAYAIGDATYAYSWEYDWNPKPADKEHPWLGKDGWEKETKTLNDFRNKPGKDVFFNIPFYDFAAWNSPNGIAERMVKRPYNPMEKVIRTVAMIKGQHPFVIIQDDIKKDNQPHNYKWVMQLPTDIVIDTIIPSSNLQQYAYDVILKERKGDRKLLVRVLQQADYVANTTPLARVETHQYLGGNEKPSSVYRLVLEANCIAPDFKILLFPFRDKTLLPATQWTKANTHLTVKWNSTQQQLQFTKEGTIIEL